MFDKCKKCGGDIKDYFANIPELLPYFGHFCLNCAYKAFEASQSKQEQEETEV